MNKRLLLVVLGLAIFLPAQGRACTIPVFRYALEKWDLTPYQVLVYHHGPVPADLDKMLTAWSDAPNKANIDITVVDLDGDVPAKLLKYWQREGKDAKTPWMLVRYKEADVKDPPAWSGPCDVASFTSLLDSPMRRAVLGQLTHGATAVYVLVTSDDADKDRAVYTSLKEKLQLLQTKIKLPEQSKDGPQMKLPVPLKVSLPLLVLDRKNADEAGFLKLLLATEGIENAKGPILFPIFGRGRVLCSLQGKDIDENLAFTTEFMCRACSCEVKALNPGVDMLMSANWIEIFDRMYEGKDGLPLAVESFTLLPGDRDLPQTPAPSIAPKTCCEHETPTVVEADNAHPACGFDCPIANNWTWIVTGFTGLLIAGTVAWTAFALRK